MSAVLLSRRAATSWCAAPTVPTHLHAWDLRSARLALQPLGLCRAAPCFGLPLPRQRVGARAPAHGARRSPRGAAAGLLPERVPGAGAPGQLQHHARGGGAGRRVQRARGSGARARGAPLLQGPFFTQGRCVCTTGRCMALAHDPHQKPARTQQAHSAACAGVLLISRQRLSTMYYHG